MKGMNASNCHPGLSIIVDRGARKDYEQAKPLGATVTQPDTDEGKIQSASEELHFKGEDEPSEEKL